MVKVSDSDTSGGEPNRLGFYAYDARGYRILKQTYPGGGVKCMHQYFTNAWQCIEEREEAATPTPGTDNLVQTRTNNKANEITGITNRTKVKRRLALAPTRLLDTI